MSRDESAAARVYHPDPEINAEIEAQALDAERADLAAGYAPKFWRCPDCEAGHSRGHFQTIGVHRCMGCGYVGTGGTMHTHVNGRQARVSGQDAGRSAAYTPKPGGFLERNPHLIDNYLAACAALGEKLGEAPEELGIVSQEPPSDEALDYFRRLHGIK